MSHAQCRPRIVMSLDQCFLLRRQKNMVRWIRKFHHAAEPSCLNTPITGGKKRKNKQNIGFKINVSSDQSTSLVAGWELHISSARALIVNPVAHVIRECMWFWTQKQCMSLEMMSQHSTCALDRKWEISSVVLAALVLASVALKVAMIGLSFLQKRRVHLLLLSLLKLLFLRCWQEVMVATPVVALVLALCHCGNCRMKQPLVWG